jgi:hypothetical protein
MTTMRFTQNDYGIDLIYTLKDKDGIILNVSAAAGVTSKLIHIGRRGEATNLVNGTLSYVTDGTDGQVKYTPGAGVLLTAGYYDCEIEIGYSTGRRTIRSFTLQILTEL